MALQSEIATDGVSPAALPDERPDEQQEAAVPAAQAAADATPHPVADPEVAAAERIAFLALASELARSRKVLVVDDGASALAGIAAHLDSCSLAELAASESASYELIVADLTGADPAATAGINELSRIADAGSGIALVRLPNRPEFAPLLDALTQSFARQLILRQHNWISSALFDDAMFTNDDPSRAVAASVRKLAAAAIEEDLYNVVVVSHGAFPQFRPQLALTRSPALKQVLAELDAARTEADVVRQKQAENDRGHAEESARREARIRELEEELAWYDENQLALRETVEANGFARTVLTIWVTFRSNLHRIRRVLRDK